MWLEENLYAITEAYHPEKNVWVETFGDRHFLETIHQFSARMNLIFRKEMRYMHESASAHFIIRAREFLNLGLPGSLNKLDFSSYFNIGSNCREIIAEDCISLKELPQSMRNRIDVYLNSSEKYIYIYFFFDNLSYCLSVFRTFHLSTR